jgi:hypothetical protein
MLALPRVDVCPPIYNTGFRGKDPALMNSALRVILCLDLDQSLNVVSPHPVAVCLWRDVIGIICDERSYRCLMVMSDLVQDIIVLHDKIVVYSGPQRRREQRLMCALCMWPCCIAIGYWPVAFLVARHVLQDPHGTRRTFTSSK